MVKATLLDLPQAAATQCRCASYYRLGGDSAVLLDVC